jgi:hypothetical protein
MNEYLNRFIQLSRYTTNDVSTDEKKQDTFLKGLNDKIQFCCSTLTIQIFNIWLTRPSSSRTS